MYDLAQLRFAGIICNRAGFFTASQQQGLVSTDVQQTARIMDSLQKLWTWLRKKYWWILGPMLLFLVILYPLIAGYPFERITHWTILDREVWEWFQLLIIPAVLFIATRTYSRRERRAEREIAKVRDEERALETYLGRMGDLLKEGLLTSSEDAPERDLAQTYTNVIMRRLSAVRKDQAVRFLGDAGLFDIVNLIYANLTGADLSGANMPDWTKYSEDTDLRKFTHPDEKSAPE